MMWLTSSSLPGIGVAESTTVSPGTISSCACSPDARRASTALGSPWVPVQTMTTFCGGRLFISEVLSRSSYATSRKPRLIAMRTLFTMLRPITPTRRPLSRATLITCWMREMLDAKVARMTRPGAAAMMSSSVP